MFLLFQIHAEIDVINASWDEKGNNKGLADSIGLMVYEGTNSLNYVKNYNAGTSRQIFALNKIKDSEGGDIFWPMINILVGFINGF